MHHTKIFTKHSAIVQPLFEDEMWEEYDEPGPQLACLPLWEYRLVLTPPDDIREKVMTIKKAFAEVYNYPTAVSTKPYITLVKFLQHRLVEEQVQEQLRKVTAGLPSIEVTLKDYAGFSVTAKKAIYINIAAKEPLLHLVTNLKQAKHLMIADKKFLPRFTGNPHITIARGLPAWRYEKAWTEYQQAHFSESFNASQIAMLRRPLSGKKFTKVSTFDLLGEG